MSPELTPAAVTTTAPVAAKPAAAPAEKAPKGKKAPKGEPAAAKGKGKPAAKKAPAKKTADDYQAADRHMGSEPASARRANLVKYLRKAKAVDQKSAKSLAELVSALSYTRFDVYGIVSGTSGQAGSSPR